MDTVGRTTDVFIRAILTRGHSWSITADANPFSTHAAIRGFPGTVTRCGPTTVDSLVVATTSTDVIYPLRVIAVSKDLPGRHLTAHGRTAVTNYGAVLPSICAA